MPGRTDQICRPTRILSQQKLHDAWRDSRDSKKNPGKPGIDSVTAQAFNANLAKNLADIANSIKLGTYRFKALRPVFLPKENSTKFRMICIPTVADRLVQRAICHYLESNQKLPVYARCSYAYIQDRGLREALNAALSMRRTHSWVLKTDIQSFFDSIPREYVKRRLRVALGRHSLLPLLDAVIDTEARIRPEDHRKAAANGLRSGHGIRQGMPLSPLLANLCLAEFDSSIERRNIRMVRYSDDLALFFDSEAGCHSALGFINDELGKLGLAVPRLEVAGKTQVIPPDQPLQFLGREIVFLKREQDYVIRVGGRQIARITEAIRREYNIYEAVQKGLTLQRFISLLGETVGSYLGIYRNAYDYERLDSELRRCANTVMTELFIELFGADVIVKLAPERQHFVGIAKLNIQRQDAGIDF